ncbi:HAD-IIIC family phosphatase [Qipengyuania sp. CAU 1752]
MDLAQLPWLPAPPPDIRARIASLGETTEPGRHARTLSACALAAPEARKLSRAIARLLDDGRDMAPLAPVRLSVLTDLTFDLVTDALPAAGARHGVAVDLHIAEPGLVESELLSSRSATRERQADVVLLALGPAWFGLDRPQWDETQAHAYVQEAVGRLEALVDAVGANCGGTAIICTLPLPFEPLFGSFDASLAGSPHAMMQAFNAALPDLAARHGSRLLDVSRIAASFGLGAWHDPRAHALFKLPFSPAAIPLFTDRLGALLGAIRGKARKCLVLDLDNTCWGGVIGDDGLEGIRIGADDAEGQAFLAVQQAALHLKERGIVLAVSSKNEDANARLPFRKHPDMLLKESDIAVFQANWLDKATNLEAIGKALNFGLDALVLLDDNAAERAAVRAALPMVAVPDLPEDPAEYVSYLLSAGYFETTGFSAEDQGRAESYHANAQRVEVQERARDLGDYLSSLEMWISHAAFDALGRTRITQLIGKSNQFNLTTRRYGEAEVAALEADPQVFTMQTRLSDRYGDFGIIGIIIARITGDGSIWDIDSWLMSCRVLGRRVEDAMLAYLADAARASGVKFITARFIPSGRNAMVADHYDNLGFALTGTDDDGSRLYRLDLADWSTPDLPFASR